MFLNFLILLIINYIIFINLETIGTKLNLIDHPDGKLKFHKTHSYIIGGIIFLSNILIIYLMNNFQNTVIFDLNHEIIFLVTLISIFFIGYLDDKKNLSPNIKLFLLTILISLSLIVEPNNRIHTVYFSSINFSISTGSLSFLFTVLCYLLFLNAINMFDGINMQLGMYIFLGFLYLFLFTNNIDYIYLLVFVLYFIVWNFKGKIFMGDSGSLSLGFFFSYLFINNFNTGNFQSVEQIFIFMALPGIDMFRLFILRLIKKKNPFKGDRNHFHHLLSNSYGDKKAAYYIFALVTLSMAISYINFFIAVFFLLFIYTGLIIFSKK